MAKKTSQNLPKPKQFSASPFDALKGVAVTATKSKQPEKPAPKRPVDGAENVSELFLQAMTGVTPIKRPSAPQKTNPAKPLVSTSINQQTTADETAARIFALEIGRLKLDTKFADSAPDEGELQPLGGNRLRQVRRGTVSVDHQLDLHGLTREEALEALPRFLQAARCKGQKAALIITGKGNHSAEQPVLQQAVTAWLREAGRSIILEFAPAPREMGGNGALVVFLRPQER